MEGAVGRDRAEHLADRVEPAGSGGGPVLDDDGGGAHADDHAVAAAIEGQRGLFDDLVGGGGAGGQEPGADPREHGVAGDVVGGDDDDPLAAAGRIQSSARATAWVVLAHAALTWVLGPRAPMYSANCECPIESTLKMKRRSYS